MIRIAAVGDVHYDRHSRPELKAHFESLRGRCDLLFLAGDLTQSGALDEARALAADLAGVPVPVVAVLGNHDYHQSLEKDIQLALQGVGVTVLDGTTVAFEIQGRTVGIMGMKGFGGGFFGACVTEFGEPQTKAFAEHARHQADLLRAGLQSLRTDFRFALLHYSPIEATLLGEKREIFAFLGSYLLAEALDEAGADAAFHGHAHHGTERGVTPGGVPVRNVAMTVIRHAYNIYTFEEKSQSRPSRAAPQEQPAPAR